MLSYQHGYHAGNMADVLKHAVLSRVLDYMVQKDKPLFYLETHAGRGRYDLHDKYALKTGEANEGIHCLWNAKEARPSLLEPYFQCLHDLNPSGDLRYYPGSPWIAMHALRQMDRLFFCERHPREFECLQALPHQGKRVHASHCDGLEQLSVLLPPPERRGLVFIDPSFEVKTDYRHIPVHLKKAYRRFPTGVFVLWYPLIENRFNEQLQKGLAAIGAEKKLRIEFHLNAPDNRGMQGSGLWIINPPHRLASELKPVCQLLSRLFNPNQSSFFLEV